MLTHFARRGQVGLTSRSDTTYSLRVFLFFMTYQETVSQSEEFLSAFKKNVDNEPKSIYHNTIFKYKNGNAYYLNSILNESVFWFLETKSDIIKAAEIDEHGNTVYMYRLPHLAYKSKSRYIPTITKAKIFSRDEFKCVYCGEEDNLQIDHIIAVSKGGSNELDNLQTLCRTCNIKKSNK